MRIQIEFAARKEGVARATYAQHLGKYCGEERRQQGKKDIYTYASMWLPFCVCSGCRKFIYIQFVNLCHF